MVVEEEASAVSGGSRVAAELVVDTTHWRFEVSSNMGGNRKSSIILCSGVVDVENVDLRGVSSYGDGYAVRYGYSSVGRFDVFFRNQLLVFQQHQNESLYDSWTRFKDIIRKVPNHGLSIWTLNEIFLKHLDSLSHHIINLTAEGDLRKFSDIGAWYAIEDCAQYDKKCSNPTSAISDETIANLNAQIVGDDMVRVQVPRCMAWLDYDKHVDSLSTMDNEVGVTSPESTTQTLPSFEVRIFQESHEKSQKLDKNEHEIE
ncbi:hypothetical protein Tco_0241653 [Tanacetum coccineum]